MIEITWDSKTDKASQETPPPKVGAGVSILLFFCEAFCVMEVL